jgi:hypothetical protein
MKRRSLLKSFAAAGALTPLAPAQLASAQTPPPPRQETQAPTAAADTLKIELAPPRSAGQPVTGFFSSAQFAALRKLSEIVVPSFNDRPGAVEAGAAEFLDFYVSKRSAAVQDLYRTGLDRLNAEAERAHHKAFGELTTEQAAPILKPMAAEWTYGGPQEPFARFLVTAKEDLLRATTNSREYATALAATSRSSGGIGYYWFPIE